MTANGPTSYDIDAVARPIFSSVTEAVLTEETLPHRHAKAQLLYVVRGALTITAAGGIWTVPPNCALWLPGGVAHAGHANGPIVVGSLYVDPALAAPIGNRCGIFFIQPLLRELIQRFDGAAAVGDLDPAREQRLVAVLLDELAAAPLEPIHLPMPADRRLRRLVDAMLDQPDTRLTIEEWGARVGASKRTLSRLFQDETGMSFTQWRQQLHIGLSLRRLAAGEAVTTIAGDLGYESVSAFIAMFRRMLGTTPARYFASGAASAIGGDGNVVRIDRRAHAVAGKGLLA